MVICSVLLIPAGVYVLGSITDDQMRLLLVGVLALSIVLFGWSAQRANAHQQAGGTGAFVAGAGGGFMAALSGIPGPPVLAYLLGTNLTADVQRATLLVYFLFADVLSLTGQFIAGTDIIPTVTRAAVFLPVLIVGNIIGTRAFKHGRGIVQRMGQNMYPCIAPIDHLSIHPDLAVAIVKASRCHGPCVPNL